MPPSMLALILLPTLAFLGNPLPGVGMPVKPGSLIVERRPIGVLISSSPSSLPVSLCVRESD